MAEGLRSGVPQDLLGGGKVLLPALVRFIIQVEVTEDGCFYPTELFIAPNGYARIGRNIQAHRAVWQALVGPIPKAHHIHHQCRHRWCLNIAHMEPMTPSDHLEVGPNAPKTHCKHGHEFTVENTYVAKNGSRHCRECARRTSLDYYYRKRRKAS